MLFRKNGWNLLKAKSDGVALLTFSSGSCLAFSVQKGWNILSIPAELSKDVDVSFLKAGMAPGNISSGLGGSPIIPLSDQDELKPDEDDISGMMEPDGKMYKDGDPFAFSYVEDPELPKSDQPHGRTQFSGIHGNTGFSTKHGHAPFSRAHGKAPYSTLRS